MCVRRFEPHFVSKYYKSAIITTAQTKITNTIHRDIALESVDFNFEEGNTHTHTHTHVVHKQPWPNRETFRLVSLH